MESKLLELDNLYRRVNSEFSLRDICLTLDAGQVHAVVGRNASGKSTLFTTIMGIVPPDGGQILLEGKPVKFRGVEDAAKHGLTMVAQNQRMFDNMKVYENIFFGQELKVSKLIPVISNKRMIEATFETFRQMDVAISPHTKMGELTGAERQLAAIARAVLSDAKVLLLDEPSTHLNADEKQRLYDAVNRLKAQGKSFLLISHDLSEVLAIADLVSVMEQGELVRTDEVSRFDAQALTEAVYGIKAGEMYRRVPAEPGKEALRVETLSGDVFDGVSLTLRHGQLTVLMGGAQSGKLEFARALAGIVKADGAVSVNGTPLATGAPIAAVRAGIVFAATEADEEEIRTSEEIVEDGGGDNAGNRMKLAAKSLASGLEKTFAPYVGIRKHEEYMTGGNRQRELMERALRKIGEVYLLSEPSAGVDVPARMGIYEKVSRLLQKGAAVLWLTADLEEAFGLADRIAVMTDGKLVLCDEKAALTREQVRTAAGDRMQKQ